MTILRRLLLVALLGAVIWAGVQFVRGNEATVVVELLVTEPVSLATWKALLIAFTGGAALAAAVSLFEVARYALVARRYRKTVARLEGEIHQLRNLPLAEEGAPDSAGEPNFAAPSGGPAQSRG